MPLTSFNLTNYLVITLAGVFIACLGFADIIPLPFILLSPALIVALLLRKFLLRKRVDKNRREVSRNEKPPRYVDENVQFSVYRPQSMKPMEWRTLVAYAHLSEKRPARLRMSPTRSRGSG